MKIRIQGRHLEVKLRAKTWDLAYEVARHNRNYPPDGYKLISSIQRGRDRSGSRCELELVFLKVDRQVGDLVQDEAYSTFQLDADVAAGRLSYPAKHPEELRAG